MSKLSIIVLLLVSACGQNPTISIMPSYTYTPTLEQASILTYPSLVLSSDQYLNNTNVIQVNGNIGQFKLFIKNNSDEHMKNVGVVVIMNDATKVSIASLARIYHELFWGGGLFNSPMPIQLPNGKYMNHLTIDGTYAIFDGDDLPPNTSLSFDSIVIGDIGLKIHFLVFATNPDGEYVVSYDQQETSVVFN